MRLLSQVSLITALLVPTAGLSADHSLMFVGNGFFPHVVYADDADEIQLRNVHNAVVELVLDGDVDLATDGNSDTDDGLTLTLNPGEEIRLQPDGTNEADGYEIIISAVSVGGGAASEYPGVIVFDREADVGLGTTTDTGYDRNPCDQARTRLGSGICNFIRDRFF